MVTCVSSQWFLQLSAFLGQGNKTHRQTPRRHKYIYTHVHTPQAMATTLGIRRASPGEDGQQRWDLQTGRKGQEEVDKADEAAGWGGGKLTRMGRVTGGAHTDMGCQHNQCHRARGTGPCQRLPDVAAWVTLEWCDGSGPQVPNDTGFGGLMGSQASCSAVSSMAWAVVTGRSQVSIWELSASKGMQSAAEGPCVPVPDTCSTAHNEAFNETLGSPARLPPARCLWERQGPCMLFDPSLPLGAAHPAGGSIGSG